jgi:perosamine synthetase
VVPFHIDMNEDDVDLVVQTLKDCTINSGAGAAIYL